MGDPAPSREDRRARRELAALAHYYAEQARAAHRRIASLSATEIAAGHAETLAREAGLWAMLADELDAYLARDPDVVVDAAEQPLW